MVLIIEPGKAKTLASAILFGIPLLGLLVGAYGATGVALFAAEDLNSVVGAGVGLALGFAAAKIISKRVFTGPQFFPQAIAILPEHPDRLP